MSEQLTEPTPEKREVLDDNARKFIVTDVDHEFITKNETTSYTLTVDWLETAEASETKLAHKTYANGDIEKLHIAKVADANGGRKTEKVKLSDEEYRSFLCSSILHLEKQRHELELTHSGIPFSLKFDEFADGKLCILEVDAKTDEQRKSFDVTMFPGTLHEVTGDIGYYGYRIADLV